MKKPLWRSIIFVALAALLVNAQAQPERPATPDAPKVSLPLPFKAGEKLRYEVSFSKLIFGGTVGEMQLSVANAEHAAKDPRLALKAEITTKGFFPTLFGLKARNTHSSIVSAQDLGLYESHKLIEEGDSRREQKSVIDRAAGRVTFTERNLADKNAETKTQDAASPSWVQDMVSAIYFMRTRPLNAGDVVTVPISDAGHVYEIEVVVEAREEVKVSAGKFKAIRLNAKVFDGRFIRRSGEMLMWVSDDARHMPVRVRVKTSGATINVELKSIR
ncbi:MAG TPA: DUF3108 domain-containing protein [Blastocatellia bacterium]|nr:DUF3108 domain-containing protein [Blastocatellia bacterium]